MAHIRCRLMRLEGGDAATSSQCQTSTSHVDLTNSAEEREAEWIIGIFLTFSLTSLLSSSSFPNPTHSSSAD
uniref:Putative ovule protein n=1 Tax=Solanum chacoense TaxID=4108 RepID=A0A0V0GYP9_SOLCH